MMNNSWFSIFLVVFGTSAILTDSFLMYPGIEMEIGVFKWPGGLVLILLGIYSYIKRSKKKVIEYSICPECKESYFYKDIKEDICPKCNVKTIEIDEYYDKGK